MWIADDQGTLIWLNQACRDLLHLSAAEVVGKYNVFQDNIVEQQGHLPLLRRVFEKGETARFELTYDTGQLKSLRLKSAASVILDVTVSPIRDVSGKITNTIFQHVDITERKRAEEALKKEKLFTEAILDSLPGTFFLLDSQGKHLRTNASGLAASGYSLEEIIQLHALDFIAEEDKPAAQRALAEVFQTGKVSIEAQHLAKDGTKTPFLFSAKKFIIDNIPYILGTGMNITERKQSEEALRESEEYLRTVMASVGAGIMVVDAETRRIVDINPFAEKTIGIPREEIIGKICHEHICPAEVGKCPVIDLGVTVDQSERSLLTGCGKAIPILKTVTQFQKDGRKYLLESFLDMSVRKKAEKALQESEKKYRSLYHEFQGIMNAIPDTLCLISPDLRIVWANGTSAASISQHNLAETIGRHCYTLRHDRSEPCENCPVERCFRSGKLETEENTAHGDDWELRAVAVYGDQGELLGAVEVTRNITERKKAEEALRESGKRLREAQEMAHLGFWYWNVKTGDVTWSEEVYKIFQLDPKEFTPHIDSILELSPWPGEHERDLELIRKAMESHEKGAYEQRFLLPDKSIGYYYSTFQGKYDEGGNLIFIVGTVLDITERKQAEEALRQSETRFRQVVEHSPLPIAIVNGDRGEYLNPKFVETLGYTLEDMPRLADWFRLAYPDPAYRQSIMEKWQQALEKAMLGDQVIQSLEVQVACKDGAVRTMEIWGVLVGAKVIFFCADLTERKRAEEERAKLEARMREVQKLESLGVLAGGIAHDFNNLLMAILGNADLALLALSPASPARPHIEEISRGSLRAADLCRQMLAYSGKGHFVIGRYDLSEICREMAQMLKVSVSKRAALRYSFEAELPAVQVDATQMRQVIMNLILNASEALGDQNGFISVATGVMDCDRSYLAASHLDDSLPEGRYVYLEVADTGCGMDEDTRRRIFDPFYTTKFTGRGLGLAAVLGIVRGHQGAIKIYSEPGQGTTFKVLLPAVDWTPGDRAAHASSSTRQLRGGTILLVDDDPHVRQVTSQMLERLGFEVLTAAHGREGLKVFEAHQGRIDCVILDLNMPEMAGDEVLREVRRQRQDVPVILSSGFNEPDVSPRLVGKGASGFIQKPYTVAMLLEALKGIFGPA